MKLYFGYDKKMVLQALRYHFISRKEIKFLLIAVNAFAIIAAILLAFHKVSPLAFLVSSLLWIALMASFWIVLPYIVFKRSPMFNDVYQMSWSEQAIRLENGKGFVEWQWNKFSTFLESPHFFHLYFNSRSFFLVPKSAFDQEEDLQSFRGNLKTKLG